MTAVIVALAILAALGWGCAIYLARVVGAGGRQLNLACAMYDEATGDINDALAERDEARAACEDSRRALVYFMEHHEKSKAS